MKKSFFYALAVIILDIIAAVFILKPKVDIAEKQYREAIAAAEAYEESDLCEKAISAYYSAAKIHDSLDIQMKIANLYEKGFKNGEFTSAREKMIVLDNIIEHYPDYSDAYDELINFFDARQDYKSCAKYVKKAKENGVETETINNSYEKIKHMYTIYPTGYNSVENYGVFNIGKRIVAEDDLIYTEYIVLYDDGTRSDAFRAINMSAPITVTNESGEEHTVYFWKNYGNNPSADDKEDIYSSIVVDGVRQTYVGEKNEYEADIPFSYGYIRLKNTETGKYVAVRISGELTDEYDYIGCFSNSLVYSEKSGDKKILNTEFKSILDDEIEDVILAQGERCSSCDRMFIKFKNSNEYSLFNSKDNKEIGFKCEYADLFVDSFAAVKKDGKWGFVSQDGQIIIEPKYENAKSFSNGLAAIMKNGKWGFINEKEEIIIEPQFDDVLYFNSEGGTYVYTEEEGWQNIVLYYQEQTNNEQ